MMGPAKSILEEVSLKDIPSILAKLTESERHQLLVELERLQELKDKELAQEKFLPFVERLAFVYSRETPCKDGCSIRGSG